MARPIRIHLPGLVYHILNRGNNRQTIFLEDQDYLHYLEILKRYKDKFHFKIFAYCVMSNHIHLILKTSSDGTISDIMKAVTIAHTRHYHYKYDTSGHVWQGRFKSPIVSTDQYLLTLMRYVEQNPVRAGIVDHPGRYHFSSYAANTLMKKDILVDTEENPSFLGLGNTREQRIDQYLRIVSSPIKEEELKLIRKSLGGQNHFSSEGHLVHVKEMLASIRKRSRGRPRGGIINSYYTSNEDIREF